MLARVIAFFPLFVWAVLGGAPELKSFLPMAGRPGSTNVVVFSGSLDPWPPKVWCSEPGGIYFAAETNKNRFIVTIATNAAPGPRLVRVYNEDGVSEPQFFIVDSLPQLEEKEPNNKFTIAQEVESLPMVVNGRLNARDDADH